MSFLDRPSFVRNLLVFDAVSSAAMALLLLAAARPLASWLGLPSGLLVFAGAILLPFAALVAIAARPTLPRAGALRAIAVCNLGWVLASIALLVVGTLAPTTLGIVFVLGQAAFVAALGELQLLAARRLSSAPRVAAASA